MSNRTFSIEKDREISPLEARVESIRRRLTNPLGKKRNSLEQRALRNISRAHSAAMPRNKGRRGEVSGDWEEDGAAESYVNGSSGSGSSNRIVAGEANPLGDDHDSDRRHGNTSGGRPRQSKGGGSSQNGQKHSLLPWADAVGETVRTMGATQQAIKVLQDSLKSHLDDLRTVDETIDGLEQLKEECIQKDEEIRKRGDTITILSSMNLEAEKKLEGQREEIEKEKEVFDQEKEKLNKRVATAMAVEGLRLDGEFDRRVKEQNDSHNKRKSELEVKFARQRDEINERANAFEAQNKKLSVTLGEQEKTIKAKAKELNDTVEQCELLKGAMKSFKSEKVELESELRRIKEEFALSPQPEKYFEHKFEEICTGIEEISWKYFSDIDGENLETVHKELKKADPCFESIPIDDSEDSSNLRIAHAQRIISDAICEYIWKPFRSDCTLSHPDFDDLLAKMSDELEKSSQGGRAANVWTALTMRALQSLPAGSIPPRPSEFKDPPRPTGSTRADAVISKVSSVLSPLLGSSQIEGLRTELLKLAKSAIDIWNNAHTGELKIIVSRLLDLTHREEWRSQKFDPASLSRDDDETKSDITSRTHPRIFTLFPRVVARRLADPIKGSAGPPGSWPAEPQTASRIETCIHPGVGLPEWSPLVVRGKYDQEQTNEFLSKALENARKEIHSNKKLTHGRRESMASTISTPSSPSQQWKAGGAMKFPEK